MARDKSFLEPTALNCSHLLPSPPIPNTSSLSSPPAGDLAVHFTERAEAVGRDHAHTTIIVSSLPALVPQPLPWPPVPEPSLCELDASLTSQLNNFLGEQLPLLCPALSTFPGLGPFLTHSHVLQYLCKWHLLGPHFPSSVNPFLFSLLQQNSLKDSTLLLSLAPVSHSHIQGHCYLSTKRAPAQGTSNLHLVKPRGQSSAFLAYQPHLIKISTPPRQKICSSIPSPISLSSLLIHCSSLLIFICCCLIIAPKGQSCLLGPFSTHPHYLAGLI